MKSWLSSTNAKWIGTFYSIFSVFAVLIGLELLAPGVQILQEDHQLFNLTLTAMHLLVFSSKPFIKYKIYFMVLFAIILY